MIPITTGTNSPDRVLFNLFADTTLDGTKLTTCPKKLPQSKNISIFCYTSVYSGVNTKYIHTNFLNTPMQFSLQARIPIICKHKFTFNWLTVLLKQRTYFTLHLHLCPSGQRISIMTQVLAKEDSTCLGYTKIVSVTLTWLILHHVAGLKRKREQLW